MFKPKKKAESALALPPLRGLVREISLEGTGPLSLNAGGIRTPQGGEDEQFLRRLYWLSPESNKPTAADAKKAGRLGYPVGGLMHAMRRAMLKGQSWDFLGRLMFMPEKDTTPLDSMALLPIQGQPVPRHVEIEGKKGQKTKTVFPCFDQWKLRFRLLAVCTDGSAESVDREMLALLERAGTRGLGCFPGEGKNTRTGTFRVTSTGKRQVFNWRTEASGVVLWR